MDRAKQREIASKGGKAAHQKGTAHEWTSEEARDAGRKGGIASHRRRREALAQTPGSTTAADTGTMNDDARGSASDESSSVAETMGNSRDDESSANRGGDNLSR